MDLISYVIPCYRSEHTLFNVVKEIQETMKSDLSEYQYEIILVNDSSPDNTIKTIKTLCAQNSNIIGIDFTKNFGQHAALMAGMRIAKGDIIICLDDDGQTPANEAKKLVDKLLQGYDAVYAKYEVKKHSWFRNFGSHVNEKMTCIMLGKSKELFISSYFAVRRYILDDMLRYENAYPYVTGLVLRATNNIANVVVQHREREEGNSGYTLKKLLGLWLNGFTAFSAMPLRIATVIGFLVAILGFVYGLYIVIKKLFINPNGILIGYSSTMAVMLFVGGIIMLLLGIIGEYIGRIYISINNAPQYIVKEVIRNTEDQ